MVDRRRHVAEFTGTVIGPGVLRNPAARLIRTRIHGFIIGISRNRPGPVQRAVGTERDLPPRSPSAVETPVPVIDRIRVPCPNIITRVAQHNLVTLSFAPVFRAIINAVTRPANQGACRPRIVPPHVCPVVCDRDYVFIRTTTRVSELSNPLITPGNEILERLGVRRNDVRYGRFVRLAGVPRTIRVRVKDTITIV